MSRAGYFVAGVVAGYVLATVHMGYGIMTAEPHEWEQLCQQRRQVREGLEL